MKKIIASSLLKGTLLGTALAISSCGGGGGGGSPSSSSPSSSSSSCTPKNLVLPSGIVQAYYSDSCGNLLIDAPVITVYIDGKPFLLSYDTGSNGIIVNQQALLNAGINISNTLGLSYSGQFGDGTTSQGYVGSATVSLCAPGGVCPSATINIGIDSGNAYPIGSIVGNFGAGMSSNNSICDSSSASDVCPNFAIAAGYNYEVLDCSNAISSSLCTLTLTNQVQNGSFLPTVRYDGSYPILPFGFGSSTSFFSHSGFFDTFTTGAILLSNSAIESGINNFSSSYLTLDCFSNTALISGLLLNVYSQTVDLSFTTNLPPCNYYVYSNLVEPGDLFGLEDFGFPYEVGRVFYWSASPFGVGIIK